MGAALSSACSSLYSAVETFCRESYRFVVQKCFGRSQGNDDSFSTTRRGLDLGDMVVKSRGLDLDTEVDCDEDLGDVWGESTVQQAYQQGHCRSLGGDGEPCQVTFTNTSPDRRLILCWIAPNGDLHHYYSLAPNGGSHLESTKLGDAFVCFAPNNNEDEEVGPTCNEETLVAAYRPKSIESSSHHMVGIGNEETTTSGGFLRGSRRKKQKITQWTVTVQPKEEKPKPDKVILEDTTNKLYERRQYGEWTVYCEPGCWDPAVDEKRATSKGEHKENALSKHQAFQEDLKAMSQRLPKHVREVLAESTVIYMNTTHSVAQSVDNAVGCFHPGRDWLVEHKMNPDKCGQVEFYNVSNYYDHRRLWGTGGIILHEFCHAYHNKHLPDGYENREIIECYEAAMKEGLYDNCNYHSCCVPGRDNPFEHEYQVQTSKHYACSNPMEYFAELSVAFLADGDLPQEEYNKWYPHNAKQLKEHDPRAFALLQKLWGIDRQ